MDCRLKEFRHKIIFNGKFSFVFVKIIAKIDSDFK
jgi:hypothetical protein